MPVINGDIHRPLTVAEPGATTSAAATNGAPDRGAARAAIADEIAKKEFHASSSTASLNRLLTGVGNSQCAITMKQSLSMTSLPPPQSPGSPLTLVGQAKPNAGATGTTATSHGDSGSEMIQARLRAERPYNSLKVSRIEDSLALVNEWIVALEWSVCC